MFRDVQRDPDGSNDVAASSQWFDAHLKGSPPPLWNETKVHEEAYFNHVAPFYVALMLYVVAFLAAIFGWLFRYRPLNWAAVCAGADLIKSAKASRDREKRFIRITSC